MRSEELKPLMTPKVKVPGFAQSCGSDKGLLGLPDTHHSQGPVFAWLKQRYGQ